MFGSDAAPAGGAAASPDEPGFAGLDGKVPDGLDEVGPVQLEWVAPRGGLPVADGSDWFDGETPKPGGVGAGAPGWVDELDDGSSVGMPASDCW